MAHPITQHPGPTIPFPSAPRPSPIGFGFGLPSSGSSLSFGSPTRLPLGSPSAASSSTLSFGFASATPTQFNLGGSATTCSPKRPFIRPGVSSSPTAFRSNTAPVVSLKRTRRSPSPTPSSSPSPTSSNVASPAITHGELPRQDKGEGLSVGSLELKDGKEGRKIVRKDVKRLRKDLVDTNPTKGQNASETDVDVGVLLAALPSSSHLSILTNLLSQHPHLKHDVMAKLPQPDYNECLLQLDRHMEKVRRHTGTIGVQVNPDRVWTRVQKDVQAYIHTASTYLSFFTSASSNSSTPEPQTVQSLLHSLSTQIVYILRLIPPNSDVNSGTISALLEFGKSVISSWTSWLEALSIDVNQRSGMYPHSTVEVWASNLDALANAPAPATTPTFGWTMAPAQSEPPHALVDSYRDAMKPIRDRFINELGWLIGRHPINPSFNLSSASTQTQSSSSASWNLATIMKVDEDEEL